jgi:hypothetical protein
MCNFLIVVAMNDIDAPIYLKSWCVREMSVVFSEQKYGF